MRDIAFLTQEDTDFIRQKTSEYRLTHQDRRSLELIASDLRRWDEGRLADFWTDPPEGGASGKDRKKLAIASVKTVWEELKQNPKSYAGFNPGYAAEKQLSTPVPEPAGGSILGRCPVASEKTRCCNLQTLDAVINCGFDCSYCSIRTFYHTDGIVFHHDLRGKLDDISKKLDPAKRYHIGTGQSSDSLMWGNREGMLEEIFRFARQNPNVLLELKSKSGNVGFLIENEIPANAITTWSLNTPVIINAEEHLTASLDQRIEAARRVADKGGLIGFHFHPIIIYDSWEKDYTEVFRRVQSEFSPESVTHVSFGTLTFIKPVIKALRKRELKSKILQMPLEEIAGKLSYPYETKEKMFRLAYESFAAWHEQVFFYLCMEDKRLWPSVFGREYADNEEFEKDMIDFYYKKTGREWKKR